LNEDTAVAAIRLRSGASFLTSSSHVQRCRMQQREGLPYTMVQLILMLL